MREEGRSGSIPAGAAMGKNDKTLLIVGIVVGACAVFVAIPIMAAIAIPSLLRSKTIANEASAIASLKTLVVAEEQFRATAPAPPQGPPVYGTLSELSAASPPYIDGVLGRGRKAGYQFALRLTRNGRAFEAIAVPVQPARTGNRTFFVDDSGVIRMSIGAPATAKDRPIE